jgi:photosystem II stability/assembly factor-like uncharacterized protein
MYAAGVSGGIWKTTNGGKEWTAVGDELTNLAVNSLALDPEDPRVIYAGTGEGYFREVIRGTGLPLRGGGIFRSSDAGDSWERLAGTRGKRFQWVNDIVVSRHDSDRIYAATRKGVFRTRDGGKKWKRVLRGKVRGGCLDLVARGDRETDYLLASCGTFRQASVFRHLAAEGSGKWEKVLSDPGMGRTSLALAPSDQGIVYALAASNVPGPEGRFEQALHAVFRSTEGGAPGSWEARVRNSDQRKINTLLLSNLLLAFLEECDFDAANDYFAMGWYVNVIAVDPQNPDRVWAGGVDLLRSDDGGRNWDPVTYGWTGADNPNFVHPDHHGLIFHPKKRSTLYSLNDGGIYRTRNAGAPTARDDLAVCRPGSSGARWISLNNNFGVTQFYHGVPFPDGRIYIGGTQDNGTLFGSDALGGNDWRRMLGGDGGYSAIDPTNTNVIYATTQNGIVHKSLNRGLSFEREVDGITDLGGVDDFRAVGPNFLFISPLVMDPQDSRRLWLGGRRLWRTDNGAGSWSPASSFLADGGKVSAIAVASADGDRVLAGTHLGTIYRTSQGVSAGAGTEWEGSRPRSGFVSSVTFDPADQAVAYATYAGFGDRHVWRTEDGGESWMPIDGSGAGALPDIPVHSIVVDPEHRERLYLGTDLGVFVSLDGGASWAVEITGFARAVTESLALVTTPTGQRFLFAFTHGRGAWRVELS